MKRFAIWLPILSLVFTAPAFAERLSDSEIRSFIGGQRIVLNTPFGGFPLHYKPSGAVTGDGSALGLARFFAPRETGRWWITDKQLCQQWKTWYDGRTYCFELKRTGERSFRWVRNDGYSGTGRVKR